MWEESFLTKKKRAHFKQNFRLIPYEKSCCRVESHHRNDQSSRGRSVFEEGRHLAMNERILDNMKNIFDFCVSID